MLVKSNEHQFFWKI